MQKQPIGPYVQLVHHQQSGGYERHIASPVVNVSAGHAQLDCAVAGCGYRSTVTVQTRTETELKRARRRAAITAFLATYGLLVLMGAGVGWVTSDFGGPLWWLGLALCVPLALLMAVMPVVVDVPEYIGQKATAKSRSASHTVVELIDT